MSTMVFRFVGRQARSQAIAVALDCGELVAEPCHRDNPNLGSFVLSIRRVPGRGVSRTAGAE